MDINTLKDKIQENDLEFNLFFTRKLRNHIQNQIVNTCWLLKAQ